MTKILVTSDWHVDAVTAGVERLPELAEHVSAIEMAIHDQKIDLVLNLGDCWDPGSVLDPRWTRFVYESFVHLGRAAFQVSGNQGGLIAIPGNHDVIDTADPTSTLSGLRVVEPHGVTIHEEPSCWGHGDVALLALPYVSRAYEKTDFYRRCLDMSLEAALRASRSRPLVVLAHLSFDGMHPGSESTDMARGREVMFPVELVEQLSPAVVLNGHYHQRQTIRRGALDIEIPGAPIRFTFGEAKDGPRGFLVVEV